jgi:glycosyltransferase involved in cell wall biosynthesis
MTFVYRQVLGLQQEFVTILLTSNRITHTDRFPFDPIFAKEKTFWERARRLIGKSMGTYAVLSKNQTRYFKDILFKNNIQAIHAHFGPSGIEILPLAKKLGIPLVTTFHGYDASELLTNKRYKKALKELFNYSYCITVSEHMKNKLMECGLDPHRCRVIYCGIPLDKFHYVDRIPISQKITRKEEVRLLQVSSLVEKKGHRYSLESFSRLISFYPNCSYTIAGDGPLRKDLEHQCQKLKIADKVRFLGPIDNGTAFLLMKNSDIFLHHSVTQKNGDMEGIPNALMEAMATGLIVISTFHSGIPELIYNMVNGYLVPEKNVEAYTKTLIQAFSSSSDLNFRAHKTIVKGFNVVQQNIKLTNYIKEIVHE